MRLIHVETETLVTVNSSKPPPYAILSHRWADNPNDEIVFGDLSADRRPSRNVQSKPGYAKFRKALSQARRDRYLYLWDDTCCIKKTHEAEMSESINSMYQWYQQAEVCYAYLEDIVISDGVDAEDLITNSGWFKRGWTLQELLAPKRLVFFDRYWRVLGNRSAFAQAIEGRYGIPEDVLRAQKLPQACSIAMRMSWAEKRETTKKEDMAYSLLGIFDVNMHLSYGEGREKAFLRLQRAIIASYHDQSIFAWGSSFSMLLSSSGTKQFSHEPVASGRSSSTSPRSSSRMGSSNHLDAAHRRLSAPRSRSRSKSRPRSQSSRVDSALSAPRGRSPGSDFTTNGSGFGDANVVSRTPSINLLAADPSSFAKSKNDHDIPSLQPSLDYVLTNAGLLIELPLLDVDVDRGLYIAILSCKRTVDRSGRTVFLGMLLEETTNTNVFDRRGHIDSRGNTAATVEVDPSWVTHATLKQIYVRDVLSNMKHALSAIPISAAAMVPISRERQWSISIHWEPLLAYEYTLLHSTADFESFNTGQKQRVWRTSSKKGLDVLQSENTYKAPVYVLLLFVAQNQRSQILARVDRPFGDTPAVSFFLDRQRPLRTINQLSADDSHLYRRGRPADQWRDGLRLAVSTSTERLNVTASASRSDMLDQFILSVKFHASQEDRPNRRSLGIPYNYSFEQEIEEFECDTGRLLGDSMHVSGFDVRDDERRRARSAH